MRQICKLLICLCKIQTLHSSIVFKHFSHLKYGGQQIITATKLQCLYKSINNLLSEMYTQVSTNLVNKLKLYHHSTSIHNRSVLWKRNPSNIKTQNYLFYQFHAKLERNSPFTTYKNCIVLVTYTCPTYPEIRPTNIATIMSNNFSDVSVVREFKYNIEILCVKHVDLMDIQWTTNISCMTMSRILLSHVLIQYFQRNWIHCYIKPLSILI